MAIILVTVGTLAGCYYMGSVATHEVVTTTPVREYLGSALWQCFESSINYSGYIPCFTYDRSEAYVFNCAAAAATAAGCSLRIGNATVGFSLTVWYPVTNQSMPLDNCMYMVDGLTHRNFASCISVSPRSFIVSNIAPSPPLLIMRIHKAAPFALSATD